MTWEWMRRRSERQMLCRHCFAPFLRERIGVVCRSGECERVLDTLGKRRPRFFFAKDHGLWRGDRLDLEQACPFCQQYDSLDSVCPHCRHPLGLDQGEDRVIAVIGASASGKSHFLATVVYQLLEQQVGEDTWTVSLKEEDRRSFRTKLLDPLFEDLEVLPRTQAQVEGELCLPLENRHDGRRFLLVFRDLGGEIFLQPERLRKLNFLRYAQGVVLMADPLSFEPPPSGNGGGALPWTRTAQPDAVKILDNYRHLLDTQERRVEHRALPLRPDEKFLAVAVTKADLVLAKDHPFWANGPGTPYLERGYWHRREAEDAAIREWVERHLSARLVEEAEAFSEVRYFFVSSFGYPHPPQEKRLTRPPRPRRVHEPIFALLDRLTDELEEEPVEAAEPPSPADEDAEDDWGDVF